MRSKLFLAAFAVLACSAAPWVHAASTYGNCAYGASLYGGCAAAAASTNPTATTSPDNTSGGNILMRQTPVVISGTEPGAATPTASLPFSRDLQLGSTGEDVRRLQQFLNSSSFAVAVSGAGSTGHETDYFGPATQAALARYQATKGIAPAIGYFGPLTRASVAGTSALAAPASATGSSAASSAFSRDLELGMTGEDVRALQHYLNTHGFAVAASGGGSAGNETAYFGPATKAALAKLQALNSIMPAAGRFGPATRAFVLAH
ncbi:MAG: baaA1 [Candidatus Adlerbacteria bacterium]|nr:baaA1 [Candidatus Adlerbacteria bacterium]